MKTMFAMCLFGSIWWFIQIFAPNYALFAVCRFMVAASRMAAYLAGYIYSKN